MSAEERLDSLEERIKLLEAENTSLWWWVRQDAHVVDSRLARQERMIISLAEGLERAIAGD